MNCISVIPNGSARSVCLLDQPTNLIFLKQGTKFTNYNSAKSIEAWRVLIQESLVAYPTLELRTAANTKPTAVKETDGAGVQVTTRFDPGMVLVNLKTNACDFKEMLKSMKGDYDVVIGLGSGKMMMLSNSKGELGGFNGQCVAIPIGMPTQEAKLEEFQIDINWNNVAQWENYQIVEMPFFLKELVELTPLGLDYQVDISLAASEETALITKRCLGEAVTDTLTWVTIVTNVSTPSVTPVATDGKYVIAVEKDVVPVALAAGDFITGYYVEMDNLIFKQISGTITYKL